MFYEMFYFHRKSNSQVVDSLFVHLGKLLYDKKIIKLPWDQIDFYLKLKIILLPFLMLKKAFM